jgi:hypothetical protein
VSEAPAQRPVPSPEAFKVHLEAHAPRGSSAAAGVLTLAVLAAAILVVMALPTWVCESGDTFATARPMPPLAAGDLVAFRSAGAYGAVMASEYNSRPLVPEVMVQGDHYAVVRQRPSFDEMLNRDTIPEWIG